MKMVNFLVLLLLVIGALNWGMVGFFELDIISMIFSKGAARVIFAIVGVAGLWAISFFNYLDKDKN